MTIAIYASMFIGIIAFSTIIAGRGLSLTRNNVDTLPLALGTLAFVVGILGQVIFNLPQLYAPVIALVFSVIAGPIYRRYDKRLSVEMPEEDLYKEGMMLVRSAFGKELRREDDSKIKFPKQTNIPEIITDRSMREDIEVRENDLDKIELPFYEGVVKKPLDKSKDRLERLKEIEKEWEEKE